MRGIHRWSVNSIHKGPVTLKMFPFDDVIMTDLTYDVYSMIITKVTSICVFYIFLFTVITSLIVPRVFLLIIAINYCTCRMHVVAENLEPSTESLDDVALDYNSLPLPQVWRLCVRQDSDQAILRLSNCNLSYLHSRAFDEWPYTIVCDIMQR